MFELFIKIIKEEYKYFATKQAVINRIYHGYKGKKRK